MRLLREIGTETLSELSLTSLPKWKRDSDDTKWYKYVCITTNQTETKSNPNPTTKHHAVVKTNGST